MQINEIMTASPVTISQTTSIAQAWDVLRTVDIRHLPVVNAAGELVGIVSDRDFSTPPRPPLMAELLGSKTVPLNASVSTIMTGAPFSVEPEDDVTDAIDLMIENKVGAVAVVDADNELVGIVSYVDVLRSLRQTADA
jgi:acetoin utilization protein AcuB